MPLFCKHSALIPVILYLRHSNGLHGSTSRKDPNPGLHATVRVSTPALRAENSWYVLHYRPKGVSKILERSDCEEDLAKRKGNRRDKKHRRRERARAMQSDEKDRKDKEDNISENASNARASTTSART